MEKVLVAFSGGVDSTFLLYAVKEALGKENILAVIAESPTYPESEVKQAIEIACKLEIPHKLIRTDEFKDEKFIANSKERCYFCKKELFSRLVEIAKEKGIEFVLDGSNYDDLSDFRPGSKAKEELGVRSPLQEVKLTKQEIRELSKEEGLLTWDKPSMACLASRIPYGERITESALEMIGEAEKHLRSLGFKQVRVRHHHPIARIEVENEELTRITEREIIEAVTRKFEELGYLYVTVDLRGYRTGSMNL